LSTYRNPLPLRLANGALSDNCADPAIVRDHAARTPTWYLYCTTDPLDRREKDAQGYKFHLLPVFRSTDLVHWNFVGDAFASRPAVATPSAGLWAPEPQYLDGRYYLYYTVTDTVDALSPEPGCDKDSAIAVATSASPTGPWDTQPALVVPPRRAGPGKGCDFHWTFDPKVIATAEGQKYIYYGSYGGGVFVQRLTSDGFRLTGQPVRVGASGRYEGAEVIPHGNAWYLFASATDCCAGPLTGYAVFVGRAERPEGPVLDRQGTDMAAGRAGGTPLLTQNGNRWIGSGHNTVFPDVAGQWWTIYHAVDRHDPYFSARDNLTRRVALLDRIDWVDGWPVAARDAGPSDAPQAAPSLTAAPLKNVTTAAPPAARSSVLWREDFATPELGPRWRWLRPTAAALAGKEGAGGKNGLVVTTQQADLYKDSNNAAILGAAAPALGDYRVELKMRLDAPDDCCVDPVQAGLVLYRDDDNYLKLVELASKGLRQVEFAKELSPVEEAYPRYGNTVVGTPGAWTWLRIDVQRKPMETGVRPGADKVEHEERYTSFSSQDGRTWVRGGTWTHQLGKAPRIGLVAMGGAGRQARFATLTVSRLGR
jgi:arabinan endo-1,5-alpha-L-arabinosidase